MKTYKIRKFQNGKNKSGEPFINYSLTIPSTIAEALPENVTFSCELTEDGILFKPAEQVETEVRLPNWAKGGKAKSNGNGASAPSTPARKASSGRARRARPGAGKK